MPLTDINRDSSGEVTINAIDRSCQVVSFSPLFTTEEIRSVTFCTEPFGTGSPGESRCVIPFTFKIMKGTSAAVAGYLAANPFNVACTWQYDTDCTISGAFNFPSTGLPRNAGAALSFGSGVATSNGAYVIEWDEGGGS